MPAAPTVLLLDIQPGIRRLLRMLLERAESAVIEAATASEGIVKATAAPPDVIVVDSEMPAMNDMEQLRALRQIVPRARFFVLSAKSTPAAVSQAMAAEADGFFDKSRPDLLIRAVTGIDAATTTDADDAVIDIRGDDPKGTGPMQPFRVLVVDDDPIARRLLRIAVELNGAVVAEAGCIADAEAALAGTFDGVILDRRLPDGDGLDLLPALGRCGREARVVVCSNVDDDQEPTWVVHVNKTNMEGVVAALGLGRAPASSDTFEASSDELVRLWQSRCRFAGLADTPILAERILATLVSAEEHLKDTNGSEELAAQISAHVSDTMPVEDALKQLHCLRNVLLGHLETRVPTPGHRDLVIGTNRLIDLVTLALVTRRSERLRRDAFTDALTGLPNRRAFDEALDYELARAARYTHPFSVVMIDLDGLKQINDVAGHPAGDAALEAIAASLRRALRSTDSAYRVGGDEFVVLLPETSNRHVSLFIDRITAADPPAFSWGAATYIDETRDRSELVALADRQLIERRLASRG